MIQALVVMLTVVSFALSAAQSASAKNAPASQISVVTSHQFQLQGFSKEILQLSEIRRSSKKSGYLISRVLDNQVISAKPISKSYYKSLVARADDLKISSKLDCQRPLQWTHFAHGRTMSRQSCLDNPGQRATFAKLALGFREAFRQPAVESKKTR